MVKLANKGFTLIEILIVIAIIGILAAIAIPQYSKYRMGAFNASALSDIRNAATAQEAYYAENKVYAGSVDRLILKLDLVKTPNVNLIINGNESGYTIISYHISGNKTYTLTGPDGTIQSN